MHVRHDALFRWQQVVFPGRALYGPYRHNGRHYYQWMARGETLARGVLPIVEELLDGGFERYVLGRVQLMRDRCAHVVSKYARR
jgi:hypothetical protein